MSNHAANHGQKGRPPSGRDRHTWRGTGSPSGARVTMDVGRIVLALLLVALAIIHFSVPSWTELVLFGLLAFGVLAWLYLRQSVHFPDGQALGRPEFQDEEPEYVRMAHIRNDIGMVVSNYRRNKGALPYFAKLLTGLPQYLTRITATAEVRDRAFAVSSTLTFHLTDWEDEVDEHSSSLLVPVLIAERGQLFDNLRITDANGAIVSTLSQRKTRAVLALTVHNLFQTALQASRGPKQPVPRMKPDDARIMWQIIADVACHQRKMTRDNLEAIRADLSKKIQQLGQGVTQTWRDILERFCGALAESYVVIAEIEHPRTSLLALTYSHDVPVNANAKSKYERVRARFGLSLSTAYLELSRIFEAESYHFQLKVPSGQYAFAHLLQDRDTGDFLDQEAFKIGNIQQYARVYCEDGSSTAHLYVRRHGNPPLEVVDYSPLAVVMFREVPPGALGLTAILSVITAVLQIFMAVSHVGVHSGELQGGNNDIAAFVLAIPAFVGATMGDWTDSTKVAKSSLSAYFGLVITIGLSLVSAVSFIWASTRRTDLTFTVHLSANLGSFTLSTIWTPLAIVAVGVALYLTQKVHHELSYFLRLPNREHGRRRRRRT